MAKALCVILFAILGIGQGVFLGFPTAIMHSFDAFNLFIFTTAFVHWATWILNIKYVEHIDYLKKYNISHKYIMFIFISFSIVAFASTYCLIEKPDSFKDFIYPFLCIFGHFWAAYSSIDLMQLHLRIINFEQ